MSYNKGYYHRGYSGGYRDSRYRSNYRGHDDQYRNNQGNRSDDSRVGGMLNLNKGSHYDASENRYIPGASQNGGGSSYSSERNSRTPHHHASSDSLTSSGMSTPMSHAAAEQQQRNTGSTSITTGENHKDSEFAKLLLHSDNTKILPFSRPVDPKKNYKVMYDPEFDKNLSKEEKKSKSKKIRFNGEGIDSKELADPRLSHLAQYFQKPNKKSKKFPFKQLPQPKFIFDKDSLGPAPLTQLVVWDLPSTTSEVYLSNYFKSYGDAIEEMKFINDPDYGVSLGIATFKFQGNPEKAMRLAKKLIQTVKIETPKVDGVPLKIALNDSEGELLNRKMRTAKDKLKVQILKREEEEKKRQKQLLEEQKKNNELKKKELEEKKKQAELAKTKAKDEPPTKYRPNSTILSIRRQNKVVNGVFMPKDLNKYIKDRPYIFIQDKYVPTKKISSHDIKRVLNKYDWTRVLSDKTGFYIVFNSLKECERCFMNEDGRKFFEYRIYMELAIPEGYSKDENEDTETSSNKNDIIEEATNMLIKEFQTFLAKDIRERIIAPAILDLLGHENYPKLVEELKSQEEIIKPKPIISNNQLKLDALSILEKKRQQQKLSLPSFRKIDDKVNKRKARKNLVPMQHALNFDEEDEDEDEEDEETSRSVTPVVSLKRDRSSTVTSPEEEEEDNDQYVKKRKRTKLARALESDVSSDEEMEEEEAEEEEEQVVEEKEEEEEMVGPISMEIDYADVDLKYQPTEEGSVTVYPELPPSAVFDLEALQNILKDEEDLKIAQEVLNEAEVSSANTKNIEYWAWKQKASKLVAQEIAAEEVENIEELPSHLESESGSFRSEPYRKINDADKIHYLPHRRKIHKPLKTIQYEDDDDEKINENNAIQSSRVNRAKNRRFAADITAQIGSESEILSLNALTKRKKPVTFARSAIHNWGLYAMEPIAAKEMIIEYVGERIRQQVAQQREHGYLKTGIGSSYLFRIDENTVIDATKKGGIARFINHCCSPSCTAKIIKVEGKKRIVIYALRDIEANEELTYDYKFERETNDEERIRCLCGAPGCKGYLN
ncbi:SET1 [[Candida] subhashii]|uniref:Histone-lysine N-methyltransferase, H3 lysine-4 specific n=1 Tax=[Candida] subhashii TaxID=561895 RepID=A0A8J5QHP7_9ASCO|nr:SET1 [[Candida] subhashii]KAG7661376.1 SET1 [[Candida] subhashii]